jgi:hypothetical protein
MECQATGVRSVLLDELEHRRTRIGCERRSDEEIRACIVAGYETLGFPSPVPGAAQRWIWSMASHAQGSRQSNRIDLANETNARIVRSLCVRVALKLGAAVDEDGSQCLV